MVLSADEAREKTNACIEACRHNDDSEHTEELLAKIEALIIKATENGRFSATLEDDLVNCSTIDVFEKLGYVIDGKNNVFFISWE